MTSHSTTGVPHPRASRRPAGMATAVGALGLAGLLSLAACSSTAARAQGTPASQAATGVASGNTTAGTATPNTATASPATSTGVAPTSAAATSPATGPAPSPYSTLTLTEHATGTTVSIPVGDTVRLVLNSTYWAPPISSAPNVLSPVGRPMTATGSGPGCHPGSGCGTVTARFVARTAGTARLTSSRTSCGEAMACTPAQATFTVTVVVTAAR
ncbi:hypothetical protein [Streptacidiphilus sp. MAP12-16]|uniref:hypothetical protein n=1 Tax=Streptacidiphilus sp. MAP12-16 TaxID=3156300 RepID=UPI003515112B